MSFCFKQFIVHDEQCAMKVGTDGVLLGAWAAAAHGLWLTAHGSILDIGTGSGLIALMLAQRFPDAHITAIDIDADAVVQANANFAASPWSNRLHAEHTSLQDFIGVNLQTFRTCNLRTEPCSFHLIISNPPFFCNSLKNPDKSRTLARHTDTLSYDDLMAHGSRLLAPNGIFSVILPIEAEEEIITRAAQHGLYPTRLCRVRGNERKPFKRVMLDFVKAPETFEPSNPRTFEPHITTLTLEDAPNHRSEAYAHLTRDFYL